MIAATRRAVLAGATASFVPAAALSGIPAASPDAQLIALCAECERLEAVYAANCWSSDEQHERHDTPAQREALLVFNEAGDRQQAVIAQIAALPAFTLDGLRAKAQAVHAYFVGAPPEGGSPCGDMLWSLVCNAAGRVEA